MALALELQRDVEPYLLRMCQRRDVSKARPSRDVVGHDLYDTVAHLGHLAGMLAASERRPMEHDDTQDLATSDTLPMDVETLDHEDGAI